ncbi:MAG: carboxylesterase family protein [Pseudomonadota bacterium]|nr:carboxylesterase family protein [Pseudomonadota bacterium]
MDGSNTGRMRPITKVLSLSILLCTSLLTACKAPNVADTEYGKTQGTFNFEQRTIEWKGIPYAQPPTRELRWQAPQPPTPWEGTLKAREFSQGCMQLGSMYGPGPDGYSQDLSLRDTFNQPIGSEDCLYLNIQRPLNFKQKLPVVVYLHGGSHVFGAGSLYDGSTLVQQGVVFVSLNYRLGLMGWLHHPALQSAEASPSNSGNFGTLDILQALTFIKSNIAAFGGDPDNITLVGQSAGASHVFSMMVSPLNHDLFQRAVMMSPGLLNQTPATGLAFANGLLQTLVIMNGLAADPESAATFLAAQDSAWIQSFLYGQSATTMVPELLIPPAVFLDGEVQPVDPYGAVATGQFLNVPLIMGITREEGKLFTQNGMIVDSSTLWTHMLEFDANQPDNTPLALEDVIAPELLPADRAQLGNCGAAEFVVGGYNDFANLCGARATTALFRYLQNDVLLPLLSTQQSELYAYEWAWNQQPFPWNVIHGSAHGGDIGFILGGFDAAIFTNGYSEQNAPGRLALSSAMVKSLARFARSGTPNHSTLGDEWLHWSPLPESAKRLLLDADDLEPHIEMQFQ